MNHCNRGHVITGTVTRNGEDIDILVRGCPDHSAEVTAEEDAEDGAAIALTAEEADSFEDSLREQCADDAFDRREDYESEGYDRMGDR